MAELPVLEMARLRFAVRPVTCQILDVNCMAVRHLAFRKEYLSDNPFGGWSWLSVQANVLCDPGLRGVPARRMPGDNPAALERRGVLALP